MEITVMTFGSLAFIVVILMYFICWLFNKIAEHDNTSYSTLNKPLKNEGKPWHNK